MNKGERKFVCILLALIIIFSIILIYKVKSYEKYDEELYDEIYSEYENMLSEIEEKEENIKDTEIEDKENKIYMIVNAEGQKFRIAGEINIPKININYPIIYETTEEYLKIAPTKLFGPDINGVGNVCIVGHNYKNKQFFSKLSELENSDEVYLMSNQGKKLKYLVYDKYEVNEKDLSCTSQDTNGNIELTLITCTSKKKNRLVVKCRAIT